MFYRLVKHIFYRSLMLRDFANLKTRTPKLTYTCIEDPNSRETEPQELVIEPLYNVTVQE